MRKTTLFAALAALSMTVGATTARAADVTPSLAGAPGGWVTDRYSPNSFSDIGTSQGHTNVLGIGITPATDFTSRPPAFQSSFYNTQGMSTSVGGGVGDSISLQLYVPSSWLNEANGAVRTDMWQVVNNPTAGSDPHDYIILGFTNYGDPSGLSNNASSPAAAYMGFRAWNPVTGTWLDLAAAPVADAWNTLTIDYLSNVGGVSTFGYSVNGGPDTVVAGNTGDTTDSALIMQAYNFGGDPSIAGATTSPYTAEWSSVQASTVPEPISLSLFGVGLAGLVGARRLRKSGDNDNGNDMAAAA